MFTAVLPAAVKSGVCTACSKCFLVVCGNAPISGCARITAARNHPDCVEPPERNCFMASSKLTGSSWGKFFFGRGSFFTGAGNTGFADATGGGGALAITGAAAGFTVPTGAVGVVSGEAGAAGATAATPLRKRD